MFNKIKKDIEEECCEISEYNYDCENKRDVLKANTKDSKLMKAGFISVVSFVPSMVASFGLMDSFTNGLTLHMTTIMSVAVATSIVFGYVGQKIITSVSKKKMKKFSNAKTNSDILNEMIHYEIEMEKLETKEEILNKMYENIVSKQNILNDYSNDFCQIDKYENTSNDTLNEKQEMLSKAYNERMIQLDNLTLQKYLMQKFGAYREKKFKIENIIAGTIMASMFFCLSIGVPLAFEVYELPAIESLVDLVKYFALVFSPTFLVAPLSIPYFVKRNNDFTNVFNNLNQSLGENALSDKPNHKYENGLRSMISLKKEEVIELGIKLKEINYEIEKRNLEISNDEKAKSNDKKEVLHLYNIDTINQNNDLQHVQSDNISVKKRVLSKHPDNEFKY